MTKLLTIGGTPVPAIGVIGKPRECKLLCPFASVGEGFVEDQLPPNPKMMVMISAPSSEDLLNRRPLSGKAGWSFLKTYVFPLGYKAEDVAVTSVMRCRPRGGKFPLGRDKKAVMESCRYYDRGAIKTFNPNVYIIAQSLRAVYQEPAFHSLMVRDVAKAFEFAAKGYRPIILMGQESAEMLAPFIVGQGGVKKWRGDWHEMDMWPFLQSGGNEQKVRSGFAPARF